MHRSVDVLYIIYIYNIRRKNKAENIWVKQHNEKRRKSSMFWVKCQKLKIFQKNRKKGLTFG